MNALRLVICITVIAMAQSGCVVHNVSSKTAGCVMGAYSDPEQWFGGVAVSEQGGAVAIAHSIDSVDIWTGCSPNQRNTLKTGVTSPDKIAFSTSGRFLSLSRYMGSFVEIYDRREMRVVAQLRDCSAETVMSLDERFAVMSCYSGIRVVDLNNGKFVDKKPFYFGDSVLSMATNDAFDTLAVGTGSGQIVMITVKVNGDSVSLERRNSWDAYGVEFWVSSLAFQRETGELASVGRNGRVDVWEHTTGVARYSLQTELSWVGSAAFIKNNSVAVILGTKTPAGFINAAGAIVDLPSRKISHFETRSNLQYNAYVSKLDALILAGARNRPILKTLKQHKNIEAPE